MWGEGFVSGLGQLGRYSDPLRTGQSGDRILVGEKCFTSVQTGPEPTQPPVNGCRVSFSGIERPGRGFDHPLHLTSRLKKEYSYTSAPHVHLHGLLWGEVYLYRCAAT